MIPVHFTLATVLGAVVSLFLPLASNLLTTTKVSDEVRGLLTALLGIATGFATEWFHAVSNHNVDYHWQVGAANALNLAVLAVVVGRYGIWRGGAVAAKALNVGSRWKVPVTKSVTP